MPVQTSIEAASFLSDEQGILLGFWVWLLLLPLFVIAGGATLENWYLLAKICSHISTFKHNLFFTCHYSGSLNIILIYNRSYAQDP